MNYRGISFYLAMASMLPLHLQAAPPTGAAWARHVVGLGVLKAFFGDSHNLAIHTATRGESPRNVTSLTQIEVDNGLSRIYGGIHFSFDNEAGQKLGNDVSNYVLTNGPQLLP